MFVVERVALDVGVGVFASTVPVFVGVVSPAVGVTTGGGVPVVFAGVVGPGKESVAAAVGGLAEAEVGSRGSFVGCTWEFVGLGNGVAEGTGDSSTAVTVPSRSESSAVLIWLSSSISPMIPRLT